MESHDVMRLPRARAKEAVEVLTRAFAEDPMYVHMFPVRAARTRPMRGMMRMIVAYTLVYGELYTTRDVSGVACWLPPGETEVRPLRSAAAGWHSLRSFLLLRPSSMLRALSLFGYMEATHRQLITEPHWYLWDIAVEPAFQGQGVGRALVLPVLKRADRDMLACYLETSNEKNLGVYGKWGFGVAAEGRPPGAFGPKVFSLVRPPKQG